MPALLESLLLVTAAKALPASRNHLRRVLEAGFGYLGAGDHSGYFVGAGAVVGSAFLTRNAIEHVCDDARRTRARRSSCGFGSPGPGVGTSRQRRRLRAARGPLDGTVKRASDRIAPVGDGRHVGGIDLTVRHRGKSINSACNSGVSGSGITSLHKSLLSWLSAFLALIILPALDSSSGHVWTT